MENIGDESSLGLLATANLFFFRRNNIVPKHLIHEKAAVACFPHMLFDMLAMALIIKPQIALRLSKIAEK